MDRSQSYERVLSLPLRGAHLRHCILIGISYLILAVLGVLLFLQTLQPMLLLWAAVVLIVWILLTKNQFRIEYEYSFFGNVLTLSKILNRSRRSVLAELELKQLRLADYASVDAYAAAERMHVQKTVDLRTASEAPSLLLVYEREDESRVLCLIETDDTTEKLLRRSVPEACSTALKLGKRPSEINE